MPKITPYCKNELKGKEQSEKKMWTVVNQRCQGKSWAECWGPWVLWSVSRAWGQHLEQSNVWARYSRGRRGWGDHKRLCFVLEFTAGNTEFWTVLMNKLLNTTGAVDGMKPVGVWVFLPCWCFCLFVKQPCDFKQYISTICVSPLWSPLLGHRLWWVLHAVMKS